MSYPAVSNASPTGVRSTLARHILADGLDLVFDHEGSHGAWLRDARSGREYLDFMTFFASLPIGYNHPALADAAFLERLHRVARIKPTLSDVYTAEFAEFVAGLEERGFIPSHLPHAFFIEGGALAVENALKTAFDWKARRNRSRGVAGGPGGQVIHFRQAFHGRSGYTLSLTNTDPVKTDLFPKFDWPRIDNPKLTFPLTPETERAAAAAEQAALDQIRRVFEERGDAVAAIIIEPIQAEGGDNHFRGEFLRALQAVAREREVFFILDEVQTGVGLTGRMWAHQHWDLSPDAISFGKKAQVCGCLVGRKVDEVPDNVFRVSSRLNSTFGGNLTDMVRFGRYLEIITAERMVENAAEVGGLLLRELEGLQQELGGLITGARGRGLMIAFDMDTAERRRRAVEKIREGGLLLLGCGERSIRFRPPLNLDAGEAAKGIDVIRRSLKAL
jgi:L-lysine 6-transaminase